MAVDGYASISSDSTTKTISRRHLLLRSSLMIWVLALRIFTIYQTPFSHQLSYPFVRIVVTTDTLGSGDISRPVFGNPMVR